MNGPLRYAFLFALQVLGSSINDVTTTYLQGDGSQIEWKNGYIGREGSKSQVTSFMDGPLCF